MSQGSGKERRGGADRPGSAALPPSLPHETCSAFSDKPMRKLPPQFLFHLQSGPRATEGLRKKKGVQRVNRGRLRAHSAPPPAQL